MSTQHSSQRHKIDPAIRPIVQKLLDKLTSRSEGIENHQATEPDDFGYEVKQLLIANELASISLPSTVKTILGDELSKTVAFQHTLSNMEEICQELGIVLTKTDRFNYVRDHFVRLANRDLATFAHSPHLTTAIERVHSGNLYLHLSAATHTKNQFFNCWTGRSTAEKPPILPDNTLPRVLTRSYIEGGNLLRLTNRDQILTYLVGADHLIHTLQLLELKGSDWSELDQNFSNRVNILEKALTNDRILQLSEEMYAYGLLEWQGKSGIIPPKNQLTLLLFKYLSPFPLPTGDSSRWYKKLAEDTDTVTKFAPKSEDAQALRSITAAYAVKKEIVHELMSKELGVSPENLHFIAQAGYHLDIFLVPGPNHSIFITSYTMAAELLEVLISNATGLQLSNEDQELLERYREVAQRLAIELAPLFELATSQLKAAGFDAIPFPNSFIYELPSPHEQLPMLTLPLSINFANGLSGWSSQTESYYYITHGMEAGERVGALLMDCISLCWQLYVPDIALYYTGRDPEKGTYFEAMGWWSRLDTQSGLHCVSLGII